MAFSILLAWIDWCYNITDKCLCVWYLLNVTFCLLLQQELWSMVNVSYVFSKPLQYCYNLIANYIDFVVVSQSCWFSMNICERFTYTWLSLPRQLQFCSGQHRKCHPARKDSFCYILKHYTLNQQNLTNSDHIQWITIYFSYLWVLLALLLKIWNTNITTGQLLRTSNCQGWNLFSHYSV